MSARRSTVELVKSKLDPPLSPDDLLVRPRLLQKLPDAAHARLTVIQTPAGYGKTSLLTQWFHALRDARCAVGWLSADAGVRIDAGEITSPEPLLTLLVNELEPQSQSLYLFIDDIHLLAPAPLAAL